MAGFAPLSGLLGDADACRAVTLKFPGLGSNKRPQHTKQPLGFPT